MERRSGSVGICEDVLVFQPTAGWESPECLFEPETVPRRSKIASQWEDLAPTIFDNLTKVLLTRWHDVARIQSLEKEILLLRDRLTMMEEIFPVEVPIETLAPDPYEVIRSFHVVVQPFAEEYLARFFDANLAASGATVEEAVFNLKDMIVATYEMLCDHEESELGPGPAKQLQVLKAFLRESS